MNTKVKKQFHINLLNIIEIIDKNDEQLKGLIKKSVFESNEIPENEKESAVKMFTSQFLQMRKEMNT